MLRSKLFPLLVLILPILARGQTDVAPAAAVSRPHLFNPTSALHLRPMSTDRPDKTESPYTVDAGHFQIELDLANYSFDRHNAARSDVQVESLAIAPINFKVGLCADADFQLLVPTYNRVRTRDRETGMVRTQAGFGDMVARLKWNLWGNDGGRTAFGAMPFVKLPTNQDDLGNNGVEGGVILPLAIQLPLGWNLGAMTEFDLARNGGDSDYHAEFVNSITFAHALGRRLGGYIEFFSAVSQERDSEWVGTLDLGLTFAWTESIQLDCGVNIGLTRSADDLNPFAGVSFRF